MKALVLLLTFLVLISSCLSARILFLMPIATKSHKNVFEPLIKGLAERGHSVSVISPVKSSGMPDNVIEIMPSKLDDFLGALPNPFDMRRSGKFTGLFFNTTNLLNLCRKIFDKAEFQEMTNQQFDLVIMNGFANSCFDGVIHKIGAPHILLTTMASPSFITELTGNHLPPSFVPLPFLAYTDQMTFFERLLNGAMSNLMKVAFVFYFQSQYNQIYREKLGMEYPDYFEIHSKVSLIMMNSHFALTCPRPNLPDNIEVGGMHCQPPKPLPKELEEFASGSEHGFVFFSLGSIVKASTMPEETRKVFINVFSKLKQRVIWKWDEENMPDLPPNVKIWNWLPQQDILGHPKIRAFITHGGLLSTQEAVYHGVPLIGLPVFVDQDLNMKQAEAQGYALTMEILDLNETALQENLNRILDEPRFYEKAKNISAVFRDEMNTPLERAIFWTEYVIRHKGAVHLRSQARNLNYFQVHSLDVMAFVLLVSVILIYMSKLVIGSLIKCIWRWCSSKSKDKRE